MIEIGKLHIYSKSLMLNKVLRKNQLFVILKIDPIENLEHLKFVHILTDNGEVKTTILEKHDIDRITVLMHGDET